MNNPGFAPKISPNSNVVRVIKSDTSGVFGYVERLGNEQLTRYRWTFKVAPGGEVFELQKGAANSVSDAVTVIREWFRDYGFLEIRG